MDPRLYNRAANLEQEEFSGSAPGAQPKAGSQASPLTELMQVDVLTQEAGPQAQPAPGLAWPEPVRKPSRWMHWIWVSAKLALPLVIIASLTFNYSEVRGASMMPGIHDRDRILVDHLTYAFSEIDRGDVVVLRYPLDPRMDYIKRVVGLPGDEVVVQYGGVWVNGDPVEEPYVSVKAIDPSTTLHTEVKPGHYFVMGDNRIKSSDSRDFGQVPQELVRGLVRLRSWPLERFGWIR